MLPSTQSLSPWKWLEARVRGKAELGIQGNKVRNVGLGTYLLMWRKGYTGSKPEKLPALWWRVMCHHPSYHHLCFPGLQAIDFSLRIPGQMIFVSATAGAPARLLQQRDEVMLNPKARGHCTFEMRRDKSTDRVGVENPFNTLTQVDEKVWGSRAETNLHLRPQT